MAKQLLLVNQDGSLQKHIHQLPPNAKAFDETWLQELLIANPSLIPIHEIDASWDRLIPLGREIGVNSGSIDNLYITSQGMICIVETKLWRNPEAHRTVIAQIISYAKDVARLTYKEFEHAVEKSSLLGQKTGFWDRISKGIKNVDQIDFQSKLSESLQSGRFLLLIIGDRIYPEVALLLETIQSAPNLEFKIGLIEMHMYETDQEHIWPMLVIPKIVGKTHEVTRAVVKILYEEKKPEVDVTSIEEGDATEKTNRIKFEKSFPHEYAEIFIPVLDKWIAEGIHIYWGLVGCSVRLFWKGKRKSILDIYPDYIALYSEKMAKKQDFPIEPYYPYREEIFRVPKARSLALEGKRYLNYKDISIEEFKVIVDATDKLVKDYFQHEDKPI
jgi:hypothetical protein